MPTIGAKWIVTPASMMSRARRSTSRSVRIEYGLSEARRIFSPSTTSPPISVYRPPAAATAAVATVAAPIPTVTARASTTAATATVPAVKPAGATAPATEAATAAATTAAPLEPPPSRKPPRDPFRKLLPPPLPPILPPPLPPLRPGGPRKPREAPRGLRRPFEISTRSFEPSMSWPFRLSQAVSASSLFSNSMNAKPGGLKATQTEFNLPYLI
uniref:Uncharacterized protein n=1 Tax=Anopheles coluzzii TaxID=1518534 RepID=A0A8W7P829_ANOCL